MSILISINYMNCISISLDIKKNGFYSIEEYGSVLSSPGITTIHIFILHTSHSVMNDSH